MVSSSVLVLYLLSLALVVPTALAGVLCEELPRDVCAFAVSSGGRRCVLDTTSEGAYRCQTSAVTVRAMSNWIESDDCVRACGVDRATLGLPAAASDSANLQTLCSAACRDGCPNIVDLYATLAAGEGLSLPELCAARQHASGRRMMVGVSPVGAPVGSPVIAAAPM